MHHRAEGPFHVTRHAEPPYDVVDGVALARTRFDKRFDGPLAATSSLEMLSAGGGAPGSAGYVAIERVRGALDGREGTFVLQHSGTLDRGAPTLTVTVVPDSGTGALKGLRGRMEIVIADGRHSYVFDYELDAAAS